ncbi:MAG: hypothetical protein D6748_13350 [Calditrichaeota bacterium]|nr:MAG: hypothetical protein D6748_13350 [Calditrichota bacterium]
MNKIRFLAFLLVTISILYYCDKGLSPIPETSGGIEEDTLTGISGTVYFKNWPPPDSLYELRIVVFKKFPPENLIVEVLTGEAIIYPTALEDTVTLPFYVDSVDYAIELEPRVYEYVVLAHRYGPNRGADWQAAGQYDTTPDSLPTPVTVVEGKLLKNIDIYVDFKNLPIQPF